MKKVLTIILMALAITALFVSCDEATNEHSIDDGKKGPHELGNDHKCATCGKYVSSNLTELSDILNTIKAETIVNPTVLLTGEYEITTAITVEKNGLTIEGDGSAKFVVPSTSSVDTVLKVTGEGVSVKDLSFELASKMTIGIITGSGKNLKVENNTFTGKYENNDDQVSRGICLNAGTQGYEITDNTFKNLRQPAYLEGIGKVTGNTIENTRGWVVCQNYAIEFEDNEFVGWNAEDIAIIKNNVEDAGNYSQEKCQEISSANNNCRIHQQSLDFRIPSGT